ncbi:hypothetical protein E2562_000994 [Oryza meyeriana var. granulata]|uniref:Uncharacterized protein n=1 Tax=Oryza meyeriana var. granulata TaxID=110450 RepID=A0A6G1CX74_9ORYZ|nr:hypothetical protein E2562_000994 [Oryza meyeriana var. granulata]
MVESASPIFVDARISVGEFRQPNNLTLDGSAQDSGKGAVEKFAEAVRSARCIHACGGVEVAKLSTLRCLHAFPVLDPAPSRDLPPAAAVGGDGF